ncbi:MAG: fumarate hydratase [Oscillospiraceae bacterium]|nr:fumarate hydratase [Oscillospiraceae bacterium]
MREITFDQIKAAVATACVRANKHLPDDLCKLISDCAEKESNPLAKSIFGDLTENIAAANELDIPMCQDTGMAVVFADVGQEARITGGLLSEAVDAGVAEGYVNGLLRCSVVADPIRRGNTNDNTPAVLHTRLVAGDKLTLTVSPKGFGSENMSAIKMFTPSAPTEDIINFVTDTVKTAGGNPCPPIILGVGIGGDFELCALLAKRALCRPVSQRNPDRLYAELEQRMLEAVNQTGVGAQGFGGDITALAVNIEHYPTHIAGLPVAVNVGCHAARHCTVVV